jgi:hypothetical protein
MQAVLSSPCFRPRLTRSLYLEGALPNGPEGAWQSYRSVAVLLEKSKMQIMKSRPEMVEGPDAFRRFDALVGSVMAVSREEIKRREAEYKAKAALNPKKRGPKPKGKPASLDLDAEPLS